MTRTISDINVNLIREWEKNNNTLPEQAQDLIEKSAK